MKLHFFIFVYCLCFLEISGQTSKGVTPVTKKSDASSLNTWAVVVGISDYQNKEIPDLMYANKDAEAFVQYLKSPAGGRIDNNHIISLQNEQATGAQFAAALDWLIEKTKEGDQALIYFSGHGDVERKTITQPGFLLCWDAPAKVYMGGGTFALSYLQEIISTLSLQSKAKVIVITDACRSGKLAGSEIGGSHATAANLAKQYANEVKIMSCQPDELSLEGPEWGGGRGVFSYYLLNGITGMADLNKDGNVTLFELERFLGDKVPEATLPRSQIPMTIGTKSSLISIVDPASLQKLLNNENSQSYAFEFRKPEEKDISKLGKVEADSLRKYKYQEFSKALKQGHLIYPQENSAWSLYQQIKEDSTFLPEIQSIKGHLAAALQDEAQQDLNSYIKADPKELRSRWDYDEKYERYPVYLNKAAELLGEGHYLYKNIKAKEHYFTGLNLRLKGEKLKDSSFYRLAFQEQLITLLLDSTAAYSYNELGILERRVKNYKNSIYYFDQASIHSPSWVFPIANKIPSYLELNKIDEAIEIGLKAIEIDSNCSLAHYNLGVAYSSNSDWKNARMHFLKAGQFDPDSKAARSNLAYMYYKEKNYNLAELTALELGKLFPDSPDYYIALVCIYYMQGQEDKALQILETGFNRGFKNIKALEAETDLKKFITTPKYLRLKKKFINS